MKIIDISSILMIHVVVRTTKTNPNPKAVMTEHKIRAINKWMLRG